MQRQYRAPIRLQLWAPNLLRQSLSRLIERLPGVQVADTEGSADVLLAIALDDQQSVPEEVARPPVALLLPLGAPTELVSASERWQALALLSLEDDLETLREGIYAAFSRRHFRSPLLALPQPARVECRRILSQSESEVTRLVCVGLSNAQIAAELHISEGTVKCHLVHIFRKLDVHRRAQLISWSQKYNFS